jgi:hypothetical protein
MSATLHRKLFLCLNVMQTNLFYAITFSPLAAEAVKNGDEKISRVDGRTDGRASEGRRAPDSPIQHELLYGSARTSGARVRAPALSRDAGWVLTLPPSSRGTWGNW